VRRVTAEAIRKRRSEDLLVYLALARFGTRPRLLQLPGTLRADRRAFFGSYAKACRQADELLFRAGDAGAIDEACARSSVGKRLPDDLYVHVAPGGSRRSARLVSAAPGSCRTSSIPTSTPTRTRPSSAPSACRCATAGSIATTTPRPTTRRCCIAKKRSWRRTIRCTPNSPG
jgi:hypothetical protein